MEMAYPEDMRRDALDLLHIWLHELDHLLGARLPLPEIDAHLTFLLRFPLDDIKHIVWATLDPFEEESPLATHTT